jgi:hypothetical protein
MSILRELWLDFIHFPCRQNHRAWLREKQTEQEHLRVMTQAILETNWSDRDEPETDPSRLLTASTSKPFSPASRR